MASKLNQNPYIGLRKGSPLTGFPVIVEDWPSLHFDQPSGWIFSQLVWLVCIPLPFPCSVPGSLGNSHCKRRWVGMQQLGQGNTTQSAASPFSGLFSSNSSTLRSLKPESNSSRLHCCTALVSQRSACKVAR